jgi:TPR repeat protein
MTPWTTRGHEHMLSKVFTRRLGFAPALALACVLFMQLACSMHPERGRNMTRKAFDPHRARFTCKPEADAMPPIDPEAEQWYQQGKAAVTYNKWEEDRDYKLAAQLWAKAAERKHWKSMINLANAYAHGEGVKGDTEKAVQILEQAMQLGIPAAFDAMGIYHMEGLGVKQDASRAYAFWELASDMGSPSALAYLGSKMDALYDDPKSGFWGNRTIALQMLECGYAQGNGAAAFALGVALDGDNKSMSGDYARALKVFHDGVKFGNSDSAGYLGISFGTGAPLVKGVRDDARGDRYLALGDALERNPDLRFPNLDKVLPLPPADLPMRDGKKQTLVDAAKALVSAPTR